MEILQLKCKTIQKSYMFVKFVKKYFPSFSRIYLSTLSATNQIPSALQQILSQPDLWCTFLGFTLESFPNPLHPHIHITCHTYLRFNFLFLLPLPKPHLISRHQPLFFSNFHSTHRSFLYHIFQFYSVKSTPTLQLWIWRHILYTSPVSSIHLTSFHLNNFKLLGSANLHILSSDTTFSMFVNIRLRISKKKKSLHDQISSQQKTPMYNITSETSLQKLTVLWKYLPMIVIQINQREHILK